MCLKFDKALDYLRLRGYLVQEHSKYADVRKEYNTGGIFAQIDNVKGKAVIRKSEACASKLNWFLTIILFPLGLLVMGYWWLKTKSRLQELEFIVN